MIISAHMEHGLRRMAASLRLYSNPQEATCLAHPTISTANALERRGLVVRVKGFGAMTQFRLTEAGWKWIEENP